MGGRLFSAKRLNKSEYDLMVSDVSDKLTSNNIKFYIAPEYGDKEDFGDVDILIDSATNMNNIYMIFDVLNAKDHHHSGCNISIKYNNFQLDFIKIHKDKWDYACKFNSWNDLGILLGKICIKLGCTLCSDGLSLRFRIRDEKPSGEMVYRTLGEVYLTRDFDTILYFLGLSVERFYQGFSTAKELFDYIISSRYFNPSVYQPEENPRKTYVKFLDYIKDLNPENYYQFKEKKEYDYFLDKSFPDVKLLEKIQKFKDIKIRAKTIKEKFNGDMIMTIFPEIKNKKLGKFINDFQKSIPIDFYEYCKSKSSDEVKNDFIEFEKNWK